MKNIKEFNSNIRLQQACLSFMQINLVSNQEQDQMRKIFSSMDKNFDGVLTKEEVIEGLRKMG